MNPLALLLALFLWMPLCAAAHGGEDHGDSAAPRAMADGHPRFEAKSPDLEMVGTLHGKQLVLFIDRYASNAPLTQANVEIEGENQKATAQLQADGSFSATTAWLAKPGKHELVVTVQSEDIDDLLIASLDIAAPASASVSANSPLLARILIGVALASGLVVAIWLGRRRRNTLLVLLALLPWCVDAPSAIAHGGEDHGDTPHATAGDPNQPSRQADGSVFVPKAAQRIWGIRTEPATAAAWPVSVELNGHVVADPTFSGRVQSSQAGRIEAGGRGLPHLGLKVAKGEILAWLTPVAGSLERGGSQAQLAEVSAQGELAEKRLARLSQLEGVVPQREIEAARTEVRAFAERKAALSAALHTREALRAPVTGIVSAINVSVGQVVDARETLFEIVNPDRLWIEATAYDPALPGNLAAASASGADGKPFQLVYLGSAAQLKEHALLMQFRIVPPAPPLTVAQPVRVAAQTRQKVNAVAVPRDAVVRNTGSDTFVWLHTSAERFIPRRVRVQPLDAARVAVTEGIQPGERVVTVGAALLNQVR